MPGLTALLLHRTAGETVQLARFEPGTQGPAHAHPGGEEIFVIEGSLTDEHGTYPAGTWCRNPHGSGHAPRSEDGCLLYMKSGHLPLAD